MAQNFIACDRELELLLAPSLREWLPDEHLAWFVLDAVAELDLGAFLTGIPVPFSEEPEERDAEIDRLKAAVAHGA
jgi:hypothetical protein